LRCAQGATLALTSRWSSRHKSRTESPNCAPAGRLAGTETWSRRSRSSGGMCRSKPARLSWSCSRVRGPMITELTAGWSPSQQRSFAGRVASRRTQSSSRGRSSQDAGRGQLVPTARSQLGLAVAVRSVQDREAQVSKGLMFEFGDKQASDPGAGSCRASSLWGPASLSRRAWVLARLPPVADSAATLGGQPDIWGHEDGTGPVGGRA
jgi:hypothetical protein